MASNVSPSSQKVEDFLSKISKLSQERLRENQKTHRRLHADTNSLRVARPESPLGPNGNDVFGISQLTFNRSGRASLSQSTPEVTSALPLQPRNAGSGERGGRKSPEVDSHDVKHQKPAETRTSKLPTHTSSPEARPQGQEGMAQSNIARNLEMARVLGNPKTPERPRKPASLSMTRPNNPEAQPLLSSGPVTRDQPYFGLLRPVATREPAARSLKSSEVASSAHFPKIVAAKEKPSPARDIPLKIASFSDIENKIRGHGRSEPNALPSDSLLSQATGPEQKLVSRNPDWKASLKPAKPAKPIKPTLSAFESKDTELLKDQIRRLSPSKTQHIVRGETAPKSGFNNDTTPHARERPRSPGLRPLKPTKPKALIHEPEAVLARGSLRKLPPKRAEVEAVPEALQKLQKLKHKQASVDKPQTPCNFSSTGIPERSTTLDKNSSKDFSEGAHSREIIGLRLSGKIEAAETAPFDTKKAPLHKPDFHAHLASIIRALTAPSLGVPETRPKPGPDLHRASTAPEQEGLKLTHPNKARARGPKRKLPNQGGKTPTAEASKTGVTKMGSFEPRESSLEAEKPRHDVQRHVSSIDVKPGGRASHPQLLNKPRKVPPPKAAKPNFQIKLRVVSGELFI